MMLVSLRIVALLGGAAIAAKYEQYILMPSSRTLAPVQVLHQYTKGAITGAESVLEGSSTSNSHPLTFSGPASVTFDYTKNIAGVVSMEVSDVSGPDQRIGITFTESALWISNEHSDSTGNSGYDRIVYIDTPSTGTYSLPPQLLRGGFRYMTLVHNSDGIVKLSAVHTHFTPMPQLPEAELQNYTGYFHCDDELINRIWYAGAYTLNLCTIDPSHGNALVSVFPDDNNFTAPEGDWFYNYTITNGTSALVDGAKRDTLVWPGDMAIAVPSTLVSTYDMVTIRNDLDSLYLRQNPSTGLLPYAGPPFPAAAQSWTYHMYSLIGTYNYYEYTNDINWLAMRWAQYKFALQFITEKIDETGLLYVDAETASADWLRAGMGARNIEANAILYHTLGQAISLAGSLKDTGLVTTWEQYAHNIKTAANTQLWNAEVGAFNDNETTSALQPQDGNSWAVVANLTANTSQIHSISDFLSSRWGPYGAPAPEASQNKTAVSPFIGGFELQAHFLAGNATRALDLMRLEWGFMLDDPRMTNSTLIEGYSTDGTIHYPPYTQDSRISHAHGWSTGPTSALTFYVAGIQLLSPLGKSWSITPNLGDLTAVDAGFETSLGTFSSSVEISPDGSVSAQFVAPEGTSGTINVPQPKCRGKMYLRCHSGRGWTKSFDTDWHHGKSHHAIGTVAGGRYTVRQSCKIY